MPWLEFAPTTIRNSIQRRLRLVDIGVACLAVVGVCSNHIPKVKSPLGDLGAK